jgi:hypothetical protein
VLAVLAITEVADHSLLPPISVSHLLSSDLTFTSSDQLCMDPWTSPPTYFAFFMLVGIPLLVILGLIRNHKKGTVRPGHTWVATYRGGFYWFE